MLRLANVANFPGVRRWPRTLAYLLTSPPVMAAVAVPAGLFALPWIVLLQPGHSLALIVALGLVGVLLAGGLGPLAARPIAALERRRLRLAGVTVTSPHVDGVSRLPWRDPATWREFAYAALLVTVLPVLYLLGGLVMLLTMIWLGGPVLAGEGTSLGFGTVDSAADAVPYTVAGLVLLPLTAYLFLLLGTVHVRLARALLSGGSRAQLVEVTRSRARLADAFEAERRRIERDLHDGAQQRLVALTLQLGLARHDLPPDCPAGRAVAAAHDEAKRLMAELRELIHGIRPQVLTDRGLPAALRELADRCPIEVRVTASIPARLPAAIETTAYFVGAEALANVAKHSGATGAVIEAALHGSLLALTITDDGRGGADPARGTGLTGLADRVGALGGTMRLSSPRGGPTMLTVEVPCR